MLAEFWWVLGDELYLLMVLTLQELASKISLVIYLRAAFSARVASAIWVWMHQPVNQRGLFPVQ